MTRRRTPTLKEGRPADPVQARAQDHLSQWKHADRSAFLAQFQKTASGLQREFLLRALAAEHSSGEMSAFARRIRLMGDKALVVACTVTALAPNGQRRTLGQLLRAEADPFYAFVLNGQSLETVQHDEDDIQQPSVVTLPSSAFPLLGPPKRIDLGSDERPRPTNTSQEVRVVNPFEARLCDAVRALGYRYRVRDVGEVEEGSDEMLSASDAVDALTEALWSGLPVPAVLGNLVGESRRRILFLQASHADKGTALEVHDPQNGETVWIHDADLRSGNELPLSNKALRLLLEVALPTKR